MTRLRYLHLLALLHLGRATRALRAGWRSAGRARGRLR